MIHETALMANDARVGSGTSIGAFVILGLNGDQEVEGTVLGPNGVVRSHTVIYRGTQIGAEVAVGHGVLIRENCTIGDGVTVGSHSVVEHSVTIGDHVRLHSNCFVPEESILEDGAWLGPGVIVTNARYPNRPDTKSNLEGVCIGRGATVGAGAILMPGVHIGEGALIGAGTVVLDNVEPGSRVVGNPGRTL